MIVGLTGGIATGKSTVTGMLRKLGAYVVDADVWARKVVEPGTPGLAEIVETFGRDVLQPDGTLNRPALGRIIFADETARRRLNDITHPRVRAGMKSETEEYLAVHPGMPVIWDVPLLFEGETHKLVNMTVLVYVPQSVQLTRLMERDNLDEAGARQRIAAQMPIEKKRGLADMLIDNSGTLENTEEQVLHLWQVLRERANRDSASSS